MAFPKSARRIALETLYEIWRTDPTLERNVKTWRLWRNKDDLKDENVLECPWVRVTPRAMPCRFDDTSKLESPIRLEIELAISGFDALTLADFWGAMEQPTSSRNATNWARLNAVGIEVVQPTLPAIGVQSQGGNLTAKGEMVVHFYQAL